VNTEDLAAQVHDLLARVPRPPDEPAAGGAGDVEIADLARRLGQTLPSRLVAWLRLCRGDVIGPGGVFGARPDRPFIDMEHRGSYHPGFIDRGWLPIAGDGCGNIYVLIMLGPLAGKTAFIETTTDPDRIDYLVASDLWHFLRFLLARETGERGWPFHAAFVQSVDPPLTGPADLLPWQT
jgi:cell wall assembly regulator SMI1